MDREIELKFLIAPEAADEILSHLNGEGAVRQLDATYFDTDGFVLRKAGFGLRVRDGEGGRKQTLKSASAGGVFARGEWETRIEGPLPDDEALAETPVATLLKGEVLRPVFTTRVERVVRLIRQGETVIEAALDRGELSAGSRRAPVCELELELKSGEPRALFDLARELAARAPLRLSLVSKAERGYGLALSGETLSKARREAASLDPDMTTAQALQAIGASALSHLCASAEALRERPGPDGVHSLRVAIRRLRALLKVFKPLAGEPAALRLDDDLTWLAGELDAARELDVLVSDIWRPQTEREPSEGLAAFGRALLAAQTGAYLRMQSALESPRARGVLLEAAAWLEAGAWTTDPALDAVRRRPAADYAAQVLRHRHHAVVKRLDGLEALEPEARHRLRLKGKTLRYAAEDLAGLFPRHPKRTEAFVEAVKALQDGLGALNDLNGRAELARQVALASGEAEAAFAAGRLTAGGDEAGLLKTARRAADGLANARPFW